LNLLDFINTSGYALAPGMFLGIRLGHKVFARSNPAGFRLLALNLLIMISTLSVARAVFDLWALR
jgi:hypothetical protein